MNDLISIIVPVYNVAGYLEKCLDSIVNQTYSNLEILLIDDGSTDNSGEICDNYKQKDNRITVIHKHNGGLSSARNKGLDIASGKFLAFIDSDDWIEQDYIEVLYALLFKKNADISQCSFVIEGNDDTAKVVRTDNSKLINNIEAIKCLYRKDTYLKTVVAWNKLYKKEIFNELRFPEGVINEDEAIIHEILYTCRKVVVNDSELYHYIYRNDSITKSKFSLKKVDIVKAIENRIGFFKDKNENQLVELTMPLYFRVLINTASKLYYSDIENKSYHISNILTKMDQNLKTFKKNKNMSNINKILLLSYRLNPKLSYSMVNLIPKIKRLNSV